MVTPTAPYSPVDAAADGAEKRNDIEALQTVLTRTIDAISGYDKMLPEAEADVAPILKKLRETHHEHTGQLAAIITGLGGEPETEGSVMGTVNKAVVSLRAMFDEIDDDALEQAVNGEKWITDAFGEAAQELPEGHHRDEVVAMRQELEALLTEARAIAD